MREWLSGRNRATRRLWSSERLKDVKAVRDILKLTTQTQEKLEFDPMNVPLSRNRKVIYCCSPMSIASAGRPGLSQTPGFLTEGYTHLPDSVLPATPILHTATRGSFGSMCWLPGAPLSTLCLKPGGQASTVWFCPPLQPGPLAWFSQLTMIRSHARWFFHPHTSEALYTLHLVPEASSMLSADGLFTSLGLP